MRCPDCQAPRLDVERTFPTPAMTVRVAKCLVCLSSFETCETITKRLNPGKSTGTGNATGNATGTGKGVGGSVSSESNYRSPIVTQSSGSDARAQACDPSGEREKIGAPLTLVPFPETKRRARKTRSARREYPAEFLAIWEPIYAVRDVRSTPGNKADAHQAWLDADSPADQVVRAWMKYVAKTPKGQVTRHFCRFLSTGVYDQYLEQLAKDTAASPTSTAGVGGMTATMKEIIERRLAKAQQS